MGEHDHLHAVVRHVFGKILVDLHHGAAEVFSIAPHREFGSGIGDPLGKSFDESLVIPSEEEVAEFMIVYGVSVRRICDP